MPEVSYETEDQGIIALADYVITGEADDAFPPIVRTTSISHGLGVKYGSRCPDDPCPGARTGPASIAI